MEAIKKVPATTNLQGLIKRDKYTFLLHKNQINKNLLVENQQLSNNYKTTSGSLLLLIYGNVPKTQLLNSKLINNTVKALGFIGNNSSTNWIGNIIKSRSGEIINELDKQY